MTQNDIINRVQENQEEEGTLTGTLADIAGFGGMFILYMGMFRLFVPDEFYNGLVTLLFGAVIFLSGLFVPNIMAALHARDKKYVNNYVFYGTKMILRRMELIEDPLVIARLTVEDEIEFIKKADDSDYETAIRALDVDYLADKDIDKKMEDALKARYKKAKEKIGIEDIPKEKSPEKEEESKVIPKTIKRRRKPSNWQRLWKWPYKRPEFIKRGGEEDGK